MLTRSAPIQRRTELRNTTPMPRGKGISARPRKPHGKGLAHQVATAVGTAPQHARREPSVMRDQHHLRLVASLACVRCGVQGMSQAAHLNLVALGKGRGLKVSDAFTIPLCADQPGWRGCHWMLDQSGRFSREASVQQQIEWFHNTRALLAVREVWPTRAEADYVRICVPLLFRQADDAGQQVSP